MADLAKTRTPVGARTRNTRNRAYSLPSRRETRTADREVNAPLVGPNASKAQRLSEILGVAKDAGNSLINYMGEKDASKRADERSTALNDAMLGNDPTSDTEVYARSYYGYQAQELGIEAAATAQERVNTLLADPDAEPSPEDIEEVIESTYREFALDEETGLSVFEGMPYAQRGMAQKMAEARASIMASSIGTIKDNMDTKSSRSIARVTVSNWLSDAAPTLDGSTVVARPEVSDTRSDLARTFDRTIDGKSDKSPIETTGRLPAGTTANITDDFAGHRERGSAGIDIDGQMNDPIVAPASGTVKSVYEDDKSGKVVILSHGTDADGNEIVTTYSHLNGWDVEEGDTVSAGQKIARMGNSGSVQAGPNGDGSHLHYRVKVGGEDVDPESYAFNGTTTDPSTLGVSRVDIEWATAEASGEPMVINVEDYFKALPPTMDKKKAKAELIAVSLDTAEEQNRPELLEAMAESVQADGKTPSFTPAERLKLREDAESIRTNSRRKADREEKERHDTNIETIYQEIAVNGVYPSRASLREGVQNGDIPAKFAIGVEDLIEAENDAAERELEEAEREAQAEEDARLDAVASAEIARLSVGGVPKFTDDQLLDKFTSGELGRDEYGRPNKAALSRLNSLRQAAAAGARLRAEKPEAQAAAARLQSSFHASDGPSGSSDLASIPGLMSGPKTGKPLSPADYAQTMAIFDEELREGKTPAAAYSAAESYALKHVISDTPTTSGGIGLSAEEEARLEALETLEAAREIR